MTILIDTREQKPLNFTPFLYVTKEKRVKLNIGDYNCEFKDGFIPPIYFERKSVDDLFGTMGKGYKRFKKEIERADSNSCKLILAIEGTMSRVRKGVVHSQLEGISIIRKLMTLQIKYDLDFQFLKSREDMAEYIYEYYCALGRLKK